MQTYNYYGLKNNFFQITSLTYLRGISSFNINHKINLAYKIIQVSISYILQVHDTPTYLIKNESNKPSIENMIMYRI